MGYMARRRTFGLEIELEVADDLIDGLGIFDERDELYLTSARRAQQGGDLVGEKITDDVIMEEGDTVEGAIGGCTFFGHQNMDMRMEIDAISEGLNHRHQSRHELKACGCM